VTSPRVAPLAGLSPLSTIDEIAERLGPEWTVERTRRWLQTLNAEAHGAILVPNGRQYLVNLVALERWPGMRALLHERELPARVAALDEQVEEHDERLEDVEARLARLERPSGVVKCSTSGARARKRTA
jgi:hypothetical protein